MKRLLYFAFLLQMSMFPLFVSAQVTIKIEKLSKPKELLSVQEVKPKGNTLSVNVDADSLVLWYGTHPFFYGMYDAYAEHRPFVLSPDMIWMLISQGFSHHINADPEKYRDRMVDFQGKMSLVVESEKPLDSAEWDKLIPKFADEIRSNTKGTIAETIIADFSTTTQYEQIASEITLMETTKAFFDFVTIYVACGIPEVTLLGTTEDWQRVYDKAMQLRSFDLDWWMDELDPILKQFVKASKGRTDISFWRNMFKWHTQEEYGAPNIIDGWIVKFFPYDKYGKRFDLKTLTRESSLPDEMSEADVRFIGINEDGSSTETMIELYGGFMGLEQNPDNFALTPKIGWMVKKKIDEDAVALARMKKDLQNWHYITLVVKEIPSVLNKMDTISGLDLRFVDSIRFPDWMEHKQIGHLRLNGKIAPKERNKLICWYPSTILVVNNVLYARENGVVDVNITIDENMNVGSSLDGIDHIGRLYINNEERKDFAPTGRVFDVTIPRNVTKHIDKIEIRKKPSAKCLKQLKEQFPNSDIKYVVLYKTDFVF